MSVFHFPLSILHMLGLAAVSLLCGLLVWPQLVVAWPSIQDKIDRFRRLPPLAKLLLLLFVGAFVVFGSTKTNQVDQTSGTNVVEIVESGTNCVEIAEGGTNDVDQVGLQNGEAASSPLVLNGIFRFFTSGEDAASPLTVTEEDIARGWQLWEVRTNCNVSYTMPENAMMASNWWMRGAFEDCSIVRLGDCSIGGYVNQSNNLNNPNNQTMSFPFGANEYSSLWAFSWGKLRFELANANTEIVAVGAPMSAVPYSSRLWSVADTNGAKIVTWENFVLGRALKEEVDSLTSGETPRPLCCAQIELRTTGDFVTRSNEVETVYRRVDPDDWDGDGWRNDDDYNPYVWDDCNDDFYQELPYDADTNAYCWIEVRPEWNTWIDFQGDDWSNLSDPCFTASAGRTYRIWLLIGKTYSVFAPMPVSVVGRSDERIEITDVTENSFTAVWPVTFTALEGNGKNFRMVVRPSELNGVFDWCYSCCRIVEDGIGFRYTCDGSCGCSGCQAEGEYRYEGYSLWTLGGNCGCPYHDGPDETAGVSVAFSDPVILFEGSYTNSYGQLVYGQTTRSRLSCVVHGGVHGGNFSVVVSGLDKLTVVGGGLLPTGDVFISPQETRTFEIDLMGLKPSERKGDIVATAMFVEQDTGEIHSDEDILTCVRIMTSAVCRWIPWTRRKEIGVGECAYVYAQPEDDEVELIVSGCEHDENRWVYHSMHRAGFQTVNAEVSGCSLPLTFQTLEPEGLSAEVLGCDWGEQSGVAGNFRGYFEVYVLPTNVSFTALQTREIGCVATDPAGVFMEESYHDWLDHSLHGANEWHGLNEKNRFFDQVSFAVVSNWHRQASSFTWPIPNVWKVGDSDEIPIPHNPGFDQRFEIDADGTSRIKKFHWIMEQSTNLSHSVRRVSL